MRVHYTVQSMAWPALLCAFIAFAAATKPELIANNGTVTVKVPTGGDFGIEYNSGEFSSLTNTFQAVQSLTEENSALKSTLSAFSTAFSDKDDSLSSSTSVLASTISALSNSVSGGDVSLTTAISSAEASLSSYVSTMSNSVSSSLSTSTSAGTALSNSVNELSNHVNTVSTGVVAVSTVTSTTSTALSALTSSTAGGDVSLTLAISNAEAGLSNYVSTLSSGLSTTLSSNAVGQGQLTSNLNTLSSTVDDISAALSTEKADTDQDVADLTATANTLQQSLADAKTDRSTLKTQLTALDSSTGSLSSQLSSVSSTATAFSSATSTSLSQLRTTASSDVSAAQSAALSSAQVAISTTQSTSDAAMDSSVASLEASIAASQPDLLPSGDLIADIAVEAAGYCSGNYARVWRNGQLVSYTAGRGLNVYVFRGENLTFLEGKTFDTHADGVGKDNSADFVKYIGESTQQDDVIVVAAMDEAASAVGGSTFWTDAYSVMDTLGAATFRQIKFRMGYALIARRFAIPGGARIEEDLGLSASSTDPATDTGDCTGTNQYLSRPTKLLRRTFYSGARGTLLESVAPKYDISLDALALVSSTRMLQAAQIVEIKAQSAGLCAGNFAKVWRNGVEITWQYRDRGMNLAMFHRDTLELFYARFFDTHGDSVTNSAGSGDDLAKVILDAPPGTVIAIVAMDQAVDTIHFGRNAERAIEQLGSHMVKELDQRESFAIIARRGGPDYGPVVEDHGKRYDGATAGDCDLDNNAFKTAEIKLNFLKTA
eukprot:m.218745 g.218745  ORF g.218745 m.218745 type:complete len:772 (-) comp17223_c0_seq1:227-2542(-)